MSCTLVLPSFKVKCNSARALCTRLYCSIEQSKYIARGQFCKQELIRNSIWYATAGFNPSYNCPFLYGLNDNINICTHKLPTSAVVKSQFITFLKHTERDGRRKLYYWSHSKSPGSLCLVLSYYHHLKLSAIPLEFSVHNFIKAKYRVRA